MHTAEGGLVEPAGVELVVVDDVDLAPLHGAVAHGRLLALDEDFFLRR
jgi:hypothetical protein